MATPKDVLTLLQIVDLSSRSPAYSAITAAAHDALTHMTLHVLAEHHSAEEPKSPPSKKKGE